MASYVRLSIRVHQHTLHDFYRSGKVISIDQREHEQYIRSPVGRTQSAGIWTRTQEVIQGALSKGNIRFARLQQ